MSGKRINAADFEFLNVSWVDLQVAQVGIDGLNFTKTKDFKEKYGEFRDDADGQKFKEEILNLLTGFTKVREASSQYGNVAGIKKKLQTEPEYLAEKHDQILPNIIWLSRQIREFTDRVEFAEQNIEKEFDGKDIKDVVEYLLNDPEKGLVINAKSMHTETRALVSKIASCSENIDAAAKNIQPYYNDKGDIITYLNITLPEEISADISELESRTDNRTWNILATIGSSLAGLFFPPAFVGTGFAADAWNDNNNERDKIQRQIKALEADESKKAQLKVDLLSLNTIFPNYVKSLNSVSVLLGKTLSSWDDTNLILKKISDTDVEEFKSYKEFKIKIEFGQLVKDWKEVGKLMDAFISESLVDLTVNQQKAA